MMGERPAAPAAVRHDDLAAVAGQKADRRLVDLGRQHELGATRQQRNAHAALALGWEYLRTLGRGRCRDRGRGERQQRPEVPRQKAGKGFGEGGGDQCRAKQARPGQHRPQQAAQRPLGPGPAVMPLDPAPAVIDKMHVMDAGRASGHARQTGEAAVDVLDRVGGDRCCAGEHVLQQPDAAARAVELVAEQEVGRAGRGAKPAMGAGAQHLVRCGGVGVGELLLGKIGAHRVSSARPSARGSGYDADRSSL